MSYRLLLFSLIILSLAAMFVFSTYGITHSIWLDEAIGPLFSGGSFSSIIEHLKTDNHPPLYFLLLSLWMKAFGSSEAALRSLSGLFYFLCVFSVFFIGRDIYDFKTGLTSALLILLSPLLIKHAQNARPYTLLAFLSIISTGTFFRIFIRQKHSSGSIAVYLSSNVLGTFTHYCFAFVLISQFVALAFHSFSWKAFKLFFITSFFSVLPFAVFWLPIVCTQLGLNTSSWIPGPKPVHLVKAIFEFYHPVFLLILISIFFLHFIIKRDYDAGDQKKPAAFDFKTAPPVNASDKYASEIIVWLSLFGGSFLTLFLVSFIKPLFLPRSTIIALFPFVFILARFFKNITVDRKYIIVAFFLLIVSVIGFVKRVNEPWHEIPNKTTVRYMIDNANPHDIVIFTNLNRAALEYYLDYFNSKEKFILVSFPSEVTGHMGWINEKDLMTRKSMLEEEAKELSIRLKGQLGKNNKIWLFYHKRYKTPRIIKNELDSIFTNTETKKVSGAPFYNQIITYLSP